LKISKRGSSRAASSSANNSEKVPIFSVPNPVALASISDTTYQCIVSQIVSASLCLLFLQRLKMNWGLYSKQAIEKLVFFFASFEMYPQYFMPVSDRMFNNVNEKNRISSKLQSIVLSLLHTALIASTVSSMSHHFKPDLLLVFPDIWKKQRINP